ncbi:MAG: uracil-DNA glycosylase, partial [Sphingomonadales bacterium]
SVMAEAGLAHGAYEGDPADGLTLNGAIIINAVRCVPPANRPTPAEIRACRPYLRGPLQTLPSLRAVIALGRIAHDATLDALGKRRSEYRFAHGAIFGVGERLILIDSYHCSRYNQNIGRITHKMLGSVFQKALEYR